MRQELKIRLIGIFVQIAIVLNYGAITFLPNEHLYWLIPLLLGLNLLAGQYPVLSVDPNHTFERPGPLRFYKSVFPYMTFVLFCIFWFYFQYAGGS